MIPADRPAGRHARSAADRDTPRKADVDVGADEVDVPGKSLDACALAAGPVPRDRAIRVARTSVSMHKSRSEDLIA